MSWSIGLIGTTKNVVAALNEHSATMDGVSKQEFDAALPHLVGAVELNFENGSDAVVKLQANGHGYFADGKFLQSTLSVSLERFYGKIV